jgi:CRISPR-associated protein Csd1
MILQSLFNLYSRKKSEWPPEGFQEKEIPFLIELDRLGNFLKLQDTRSPVGKNLVPRKFRVPQERERSGSNAWKTTNILWDHYGYVLGWPKSDSAKDKEMAQKQHCAFSQTVADILIACPADDGIKAVNLFLKSDQIQKVFQDPLWPECKKKLGCNMGFRLNDTQALVCESDNVRGYLAKTEMEEDGEEKDLSASPDIEGMCLITGERSSIARLHRRTPLPHPRSKSNARIVSFQKNMGFDSYGKEQSYNAPTGKFAVFAYTTALNTLLSRGSRQKIQIGDMTTVFWAEKELELENNFASIFGFEASDFDKEVANQKRAEYIQSLFKAPDSGYIPPPDKDTRFYVLGLAPNAARISVRFWYMGAVTEVEQNIRSHFNDMAIAHSERDDEYPKLWVLLKSLALAGDLERLPPNISGDWMRSILSGRPYPRTLLMTAIRRTHAEREVGYSRASIIKGCLNRNARIYCQKEKEVEVSLDESNMNQGYLSGRLFAVLERCQTRANPGLNATILDRFYGSASTTPVVAFPHLLKLNKHHLAKLENKGESFNLNKLIGEIVDGIMAMGFPAHLSLEDQGRFAIGYYHQNQAFFKKKSDSSENVENKGGLIQ